MATLKTWKLTLKIQVSDNWIQDGANPAEWTGQIEELITNNFLTYSYEDEFKVNCTVSNSPHKDVINKILE